MASLLNVNTIQNASGGSFDQYLKTPLRDYAIHTNNTLTTGTWYSYDVDLFLVVSAPAGYGTYCYFYVDLVPANDGNSGITSSYYLNMYNMNYAPLGTYTTSTYLVPKDWTFRVRLTSGGAPEIKTFTV